MLPVYLLPLLPFLGFLVLILFGRRFPGPLAGALASALVGLAFVVALIDFFSVRSVPMHELLWSWLPGIGGKGHNLEIGFYLDRLSSLMTLVVTGVGFLIHVFSIGYMEHDPRFPRFFAFLNFFVAPMLILVLADSYPLMFVGWEGVGVASYLLIGFWFEGKINANAARKAFVMNRIGDLGFLLGIFLIFRQYGTTVLPSLAKMPIKTDSALELICLFLLVGAIGKSAQLPLTTWLADAMAGPTPVSALIHAATMVTAGVYLVARSHFFFSQAPVASSWVAWVGGLTALYGALSAMNQYDIKKILAYSTISQLGYMFMAVGVGAYWAGMYHLVTHAFFKALLFLAAGSVIHALQGEQDTRKMGGLAKTMPLTGAVGLIAVLAISGIPPFSGFFSKEAILGASFAYSPWLWAVGTFTALLTAFYMLRWYLLVFSGTYRGQAHPHESGPVMAVPLVALAILAALGGVIGPQLLGSNWLENYLKPVLGLPSLHNPATTELSLIAIAVLLALLGFLWAYLRYRSGRLTDLRGFGPISAKALYLDDLYAGSVASPSKAISGALERTDRVFGGGMSATGEVLTEPGRWTNLWQSGFVRVYALSMLLGTLLLVLYLAVRMLGGSL